MKSFNSFLNEAAQELVADHELSEQFDELAEALITFGGKAYPKEGHVVIMAGGAGSGKGFIKDKLLGIEGISYDVDELKTLAAKAPGIVARAKSEFGDDLPDLASKLGQGEGKYTTDLHLAVKKMNLDKRYRNKFVSNILFADPRRKPNIIFDVTMKDVGQLSKLTSAVKNVGYDPKNIHIVWVVNDVEVAKKQNAKRSRFVPVDILVSTHRGASTTMMDIMNMGKDITKYMDGSIVMAFNKVGVDSDVVIKKDDKGSTKSKHGSDRITIKKANYIVVKKPGKPVTSVKDLDKDIRRKIHSYVPKSQDWV